MKTPRPNASIKYSSQWSLTTLSRITAPSPVTKFSILPGYASVLGFHMGAEVHPRSIPPDEKGLPSLVLTFDEVEGSSESLFVHSLHPLLGQRSCIFYAAVRIGVHHAPRAEPLTKLGIFGVVLILRFLFRVEVAQVAKEFIEAVV